MNNALVAGAIFAVTYLIITTDKVHRTVVAMAGAVGMILLRVIGQDKAFLAIDFNVIFLLAGMMIIANIMRTTGVFQWVAIRSVKIAGGDPFRILVVLALLTAVFSAFLDNVTTVVLIAPITLYIASGLGINPLPFLIAEILASNIGGTATLIGDPPNILIGSAARLDFVTFAANLTPVAIIILVVFLITARFLLFNSLKSDAHSVAAIFEIDEAKVITDHRLLRKSLLVLCLTIIGFLVHGLLHYQPATVALFGAVVLLLLSGHDPHDALREVEWTTLFFFIGLFILVGGIVEAGLIGALARGALALTHGDLTSTVFLLLWLSAILSAIVDNIPYTATMIPLVQDLGQYMQIAPLWWALALGACLGGNATIIGASANVIMASIADRAGYPIRFWEFVRYGGLVTLESLLISTAYIWFFYLR
ncbi:MAG: ArsB/NhaD family transporter [Chloroflexi bacterium]|nr:ArsB/NhaD family transporter [Chloroflexota bacterium]MCL5075021.1 ArsB/NhaD family transporter [Chloroflexota bacterium]